MSNFSEDMARRMELDRDRIAALETELETEKKRVEWLEKREAGLEERLGWQIKDGFNQQEQITAMQAVQMEFESEAAHAKANLNEVTGALADAIAEREKLDSLPKTADGVTVILGMTLWAVGGLADMKEVQPNNAVHAIYFYQWQKPDGTTGTDYVLVEYDRCYSTFEAAKAAKEGS